MVVSSGELNKSSSMVMTMGAIMKGDAELEAWNSSEAGNKGDSFVRVYITLLNPCTFVFSFSMMGFSYSLDTLTIVSSGVSPGSGFSIIPVNV